MIKRPKWIVLLCFLPALIFAVEVVELTGLYFQLSPTKSHLTFFLSKKTTARIQYLSDRVIIELMNISNTFKIEDAKFKNSNIVSISSKKTSEGVQFIFIVKQHVKWFIHFVPNRANKGARLQVDIISLTNQVLKQEDKNHAITDTKIIATIG